MLKILCLLCVIPFLTTGSCQGSPEKLEDDAARRANQIQQSQLNVKNATALMTHSNQVLRAMLQHTKSMKEACVQTRIGGDPTALAEDFQAAKDEYFNLLEKQSIPGVQVLVGPSAEGALDEMKKLLKLVGIPQDDVKGAKN